MPDFIAAIVLLYILCSLKQIYIVVTLNLLCFLHFGLFIQFLKKKYHKAIFLIIFFFKYFSDGNGQSIDPKSPTLKAWLLFCTRGEPRPTGGRG